MEQLQIGVSGWQIGLVLVWLGLIGGVSELARRFGYSSEITRKIVHIGAGHVILLAWWFMLPAWIGVAASVIFGAVALISYRWPILPGINSVGRRSWGTFFYAISIGVLMGWCWPQGYPYFGVVGILIMCWGDGLAALVGQRWGTHGYEIWSESKSIEGSLTMALTSAIVVLVVLGTIQGLSLQLLLVAIGVAIAATILEAVSKYGVDNLTVPIGSAATALALSQLLASG
ncbi:diacylglycerol/polyprenol kinase family protein [Leptothoe kymatousa]|uniref:Phosphatidate cytidylyltransferase n=1 Tax=Leptothoe kymatousa TAU-MAC 1615 TaxID=2364775 RepID=A0ABS5Y2T3_9CYAN|nr:diacylglycerol/polyprenol kinase family protein [Leptothoe kymatousa]MBT9311818.1 phosphatidate cytidylyltransferase [Leptothoe kymatousa TAU-MAC 1615]